MSGVSDGDYEHACRVWREFGIRNMGEYHDLYLRTNVILLANVFESFRQVCLENHGLDPSHFYTAPGLAWKACLKKTGVTLELLLDPDMLLMFECGIRGGITQSVHRWAEANNQYMGSEYDESKPTRYLQYLDANNLYMVGRCLNRCQLENFFGLSLERIGTLKRLLKSCRLRKIVVICWRQMLGIPKNYTIITMIYHLCVQRRE